MSLQATRSLYQHCHWKYHQDIPNDVERQSIHQKCREYGSISPPTAVRLLQIPKYNTLTTMYINNFLLFFGTRHTVHMMASAGLHNTVKSIEARWKPFFDKDWHSQSIFWCSLPIARWPETTERRSESLLLHYHKQYIILRYNIPCNRATASWQ